jgi:DNA-binding NarL/FixJ family response regulator
MWRVLPSYQAEPTLPSPYTAPVINKTRFVVLEDHPVVRSALVQGLVLTLEHAEVVYQGSSIADALKQITQEGAECALVDLDLGDTTDPIENVRALVDAGVPVMILSAMSSPQVVRECMRLGAYAFVSKQSTEETIIAAINSTLRREPFMSVSLAIALAGEADPDVALSEQERIALTYYASGMKLDAVARRMNISRTTAQEYIKRVRAKYTKAGFAVSTKTDLYKVARSSGLIA